MPESDDTCLLRSFCASRDEEAFTRLVRRYLPMVQTVARRRLGSVSLAEEAAQNVFALLARKAAAVARHPERLAAWLHRTAFFEASNLARSEARFARIPAPQPTEAIHPAAMNRPEVFEQLEAALQALPETDRELLLRRYWKNEDFHTIAAALDRSVASCHKRVERSLTKLGTRLGRTVSSAAAATALTAMKPSASAALPVVERIAEEALRRAGSAAGGTAGIFTGSVVAASVAAVFLGGWLGSDPADSAVPSAARSRTLPPENRVPPTAALPLPPREASVRPALQDVLASIDVGRWGPLVAFLADATPAELRVMLEDRLICDGYNYEPNPENTFSNLQARLMLRRWTALEPEAALQWSQGLSLGGQPAARVVFAEWLKFDPAGATAAFAKLPEPQTRFVLDLISYGDSAPVEVLLKAFPKLRWALGNSRYKGPSEEDPAATQKVIAEALAGRLHADRDLKKVTEAFSRLAQSDPQAALDEASRLSAEPMRTAALALSRTYAGKSGMGEQMAKEAPPSWDRARLTGEMVKALAVDNPGAAAGLVKTMAPGSDRDAGVAALVNRWADTDPWLLLDVLCSLRGTIANGTNTVAVRGFESGLNGLDINASSEPSWYVGRALYAAALEDPQRALGFIPKLAPRFTKRGRTGSAHVVVVTLLKRVMKGWAFNDPGAEKAWAEEITAETAQRIGGKASHELHSLTP